jgi:hypothetical protein
LVSGFEADEDDDAIEVEVFDEGTALEVGVDEAAVVAAGLTNIVLDPDPDPVPAAAALLTNPNDPPCLRFLARGVLKSGKAKG